MYNQELIETVEFLKAKRIIKKDVDIVASTGFSNTVVSNYLKGKIKASRNFVDKFEEVYNVKISDKKVVNLENKDQFPELRELIRANVMMAESILNSSESQKIDAEVRQKLVDSNADYAKLLKEALKPTANASSGTQIAETTISGDLLEVLAEIASGKSWKSKQEAVRALGMRLLPRIEKKEKLDTPAGVGR